MILALAVFACTAGECPSILAALPANRGNLNFKSGVHNALGAAPATLAISTAPGVSVLSGVNVNLAFNGGELLVPWVLNGTPGVAGDGYGTLKLVVPSDPGLSGLSLFAQWFVWDGGAAPAAARASSTARARRMIATIACRTSSASPLRRTPLAATLRPTAPASVGRTPIARLRRPPSLSRATR